MTAFGRYLGKSGMVFKAEMATCQVALGAG